MPARRISPTLAPLLELLELEQPRVIGTAELSALANQSGIVWPVDVVVQRLRENGWLLDLATRGVWEYAPAARAGAYGSGDPLIELHAALSADPDAPYAVAAESAAYLLGLSSRRPVPEVLGAPPGVRAKPAFRHFRLVRWVPTTPCLTIDGLPVWGPATLLAFMASRPSGYKDWPNVGEWVAQAAARAASAEIGLELGGQPRGAWMRAAYLLEQGRQPERAADVLDAAPAGQGPYRLGARETRGQYSARYDVIDSSGMEVTDE